MFRLSKFQLWWTASDATMAFSAVHCSGRFESGAVFFVIERGFKRPSSASLIARYILRLGQAAQKQQQPRCPNLDIRERSRRRSLTFSTSRRILWHKWSRKVWLSMIKSVTLRSFLFPGPAHFRKDVYNSKVNTYISKK